MESLADQLERVLSESDVQVVSEHRRQGVTVVPIADRAATALAVGMALAGTRTVVELSTSRRLLAALEPLAEASTFAAAGTFRVPLVVRVPYGTEGGPIDAPLGWLTGLGLRVVAVTPETGASLLRAAIAHEEPVVLLEPRRSLPRRAEPVEARLDTARVLREGQHVTLAAWGADLPLALEAADVLARRGVQAAVLDLVSLSPVDRATLGDHLRRTGRIVVVHPKDPDLAERITRVGLHESFLYLESPLEAVTSDDPGEIARVAEASVNY